MKIATLTFTLSWWIVNASAAEFATSSVFDSVESFAAAAKAFQPAASKTDLSDLFTVIEWRRREDPKTGKPMGPAASGKSITATAITAAEVLWANESNALVYVAAAPPTEDTRSAVGVLFLLTHSDKGWHIGDQQRFTAMGKEAEVTAKMTASAGTGYHLGSGYMSPVVTIKEAHGVQGYAYQLSASYSFADSKLKRLDMK